MAALGCAAQFDDVASSFVEVTVTARTAGLTSGQRALAPLVLSLLFESPCRTASGELRPYEDVVNAVADATLSAGAGLGFGGGRFTPGAFGELAVVSARAAADRYADVVALLADCLLRGVVTAERVKVQVAKALASVPHYRRDGASVASAAHRQMAFDPAASNKGLVSFVAQERALQALQRRLDAEPAAAVAELEGVRRALFGCPERLGVHAASRLAQLRQPTVTAPWEHAFAPAMLEFAASCSAAGAPPGPLGVVRASLGFEQLSGLSGRGCVVGVSSCESGYLEQSGPGVSGFSHPDLAPLMVAIEYLTQVRRAFGHVSSAHDHSQSAARCAAAGLKTRPPHPPLRAARGAFLEADPRPGARVQLRHQRVAGGRPHHLHALQGCAREQGVRRLSRHRQGLHRRHNQGARRGPRVRICASLSRRHRTAAFWLTVLFPHRWTRRRLRQRSPPRSSRWSTGAALAQQRPAAPSSSSLDCLPCTRTARTAHGHPGKLTDSSRTARTAHEWPMCPHREKTALAAGKQSLFSFFRGAGAAYGRRLVDSVRAVTAHQAHAALVKYVLPLFDPAKTNCAVCCNPRLLKEVAADFAALGRTLAIAESVDAAFAVEEPDELAAAAAAGKGEDAQCKAEALKASGEASSPRALPPACQPIAVLLASFSAPRI